MAEETSAIESTRTDVRLSFLLELSDLLRRLSDPISIQAESCGALGRHLGANRVFWAEVVDETDLVMDVQYVSGVDRIPPGRYPIAAYGDRVLAHYYASRVIVIEDYRTDPRVEGIRDRAAAHQILGSVSVPLMKEGRCVALLGVHAAEPRRWGHEQLVLVQETAQRTWDAIERARAEQALRTSEEKYRSLVESLDEGYILGELVRDQDGRPLDVRYLEMNAAVGTMTGKPISECIGKLRSEVFGNPGNDMLESVARVVDSGEALTRVEAYNARIDRWYESNIYPRGGDVVAVFYAETTARKRVELAFRERDERQRFLLELSDALRPLTSAAEIAAVTAERLGRHMRLARCLYGAVDDTGEWFRFERDWTDGTVVNLSGTVRLADFGNLVDIYEGRTLVIDDSRLDERTAGSYDAFARIGEIRASVAVPLMKGGRFVAAFAVHDTAPRKWTPSEISLVEELAERTWAAVERARAETALKESEQRALSLLAEARSSRADAEAANRSKDEFLATLSHELRTPLAAILLWAGALRSGAVAVDELVHALDAIIESAKSQSHLIEDLLDLSRLSSGNFSLSRSATDVGALARASFDMLRPMAEAKRISISLDVERDLGRVVVDGGRLKQIVWNLLTNATKFTPEGGKIALRVRKGDGELEIDVADSGEGIPLDFLPHVFERFRQADMAETRQHMGLGIGLALAKQLTILHGGTIAAESDGPGHGALFRVRLPWIEPGSERPCAGAAADDHGSTPLSGLRVLVVEDDVSTREAMEWTLDRAGATVIGVSRAEDAFAVLERADAVEVIVSDLGLPGTSGYELIERIAEDFRRGGRPIPPACAVSAHARDVDRQRAIDAGFDIYLAKPITPTQLVEAVTDLRDILSSGEAPR